MPYWVDKLINDPTCELPCWENITPGETHIQEVRPLLSQIAGVINIIGPRNVSQRSAYMAMEWYMAANKAEHPNYWCTAYAKDANSVISMLDLGIDADVYTDFSLKEAIEGFGEPDYLQVYYCDGTFCKFRLVYPENGLVLEVLLRDLGDYARLTEESSISAIILLPVGLQSYSDHLLWPSPNTQAPLVPWQGYGEYEESGEFTPHDK